MPDIDTDSPEFKKAVKDAIDEATSGLVAKRDELLREVKKLRSGQQIDPADVTKLEEQVDALKAQNADLTKAAAKATKDADVARKTADEVSAREQRLLVDNGLNDALAKAGVTNPVLVKAAKALLASQAQVVADGDNRIVKVGDKAIADFASEWAGTDEGKHFVTAPNNSGGGSQGGQNKGGGAAKSITRAQFDGLDPAARSAHFTSGGVVTD